MSNQKKTQINNHRERTRMFWKTNLALVVSLQEGKLARKAAGRMGFGKMCRMEQGPEEP